MARRETPLWRRYLTLWGEDVRADIDDELSFHLESRVRDLEGRGLSNRDARAQAELGFGDVSHIRKELERMNEQHVRAARRASFASDLRADLRIAYRLLVRRPVYALAVIATLALGIGASTTIYGLVHGVLLRGLPYPDGDRLVVLWERNLPRGKGENVVSVPNFEAWRARSKSFTALAGLVPARFTVLGDTPDRIYGGEVSPEWFEVVGVAPRIGRGFTLDDARGGAVIVLSHGLWVRRFGADPGIVGRTIQLQGAGYEVLGVMPEDFDGPRFGWLERQDFWVPFVPSEDNRGWGRFLLVLGRMRPGVQLADAQRELTGIAADLARLEPKNREWTADAVTLREQLTGDLSTPLLVLLGAVALLQLIAVVNVASLVLARSQERDLEFSVRAALGAGRRRLVRQLLAEATALVSIGAPVGLLLAVWITRTLTPLLPPDLPRLESIRVDGVVLVFGAGLALLTFLAIGLVPVGRLAGVRLEARLRESSGRATRSRASSGVIVVEIALALTLTIAAGLAVRSFVNLRTTELGFRPDGVTSMRLTLGAGYESDESRAIYYAEVIERLRGVPGVEAVGAANARPLNEGSPATGVQLAGKPLELPPVATIRVVTPDYFRTLRTRLADGRAHDERDRADAPIAFVVSQSLAGTLSPDRSIVGQRLTLVGMRWRTDESEVAGIGTEGEIVGITEDVRLGGPAAATAPAVYIAHAQWPREAMDVLVRSTLPLAVQADALRSAVWSVDRNVPIQQMETLDQVLSLATAQDRVNMLILVLFSVVALALAGTGIYGVLAIEVGQRRRELGIRMSLGAEPGQLRRMVLSRALATSLLGITIGTALAYAGTRTMRAMLHEVSPADPRAFGASALVMVAIALAAAYVPARRATRIDPLLALRSD